MPCLRHTSTVFVPDSCSRRIAIICSSLNRLRFIVRPPLGSDSTQIWTSSGAQVKRKDSLQRLYNVSRTRLSFSTSIPLNYLPERAHRVAAVPYRQETPS